MPAGPMTPPPDLMEDAESSALSAEIAAVSAMRDSPLFRRERKSYHGFGPLIGKVIVPWMIACILSWPLRALIAVFTMGFVIVSGMRYYGILDPLASPLTMVAAWLGWVSVSRDIQSAFARDMFIIPFISRPWFEAKYRALLPPLGFAFLIHYGVILLLYKGLAFLSGSQTSFSWFAVPVGQVICAAWRLVTTPLIVYLMLLSAPRLRFAILILPLAVLFAALPEILANLALTVAFGDASLFPLYPQLTYLRDDQIMDYLFLLLGLSAVLTLITVYLYKYVRERFALVYTEP